MLPDRDDLTGLATWDAHREAWVPLHGKQASAAAVLGDAWAWDGYYGAFFANPGTEKPVPVQPSTRELMVHLRQRCNMVRTAARAAETTADPLASGKLWRCIAQLEEDVKALRRRTGR